MYLKYKCLRYFVPRQSSVVAEHRFMFYFYYNNQTDQGGEGLETEGL